MNDKNQKKRVLLVEENLEVAQVFKSYLELFGFEVVVESKAHVALERAHEGLFDAYIIDIPIDGIEKIEIARKLRSMPHAKTSVIVGTTAYPDDYQKIALAAGFDDFFIKPINVDKIIAALMGES